MVASVGEALRADSSCWYYDYDGLQRLTKADWKDSGGTTLYSYPCTYDKVCDRTELSTP